MSKYYKRILQKVFIPQKSEGGPVHSAKGSCTLLEHPSEEEVWHIPSVY